MRYRKRIKIAKGVSLNLSGSGASLTLGVKGASVNIGKKGTYLNTGIPGTGLYSRRKISGGSSSRNAYSNTQQDNYRIKVSLDDKGKPVLNVFDLSGYEIFDESIIRKAKRNYQYKEAVERLSMDKYMEVQNDTKDFIEIYKLSHKLINPSIIENRLQKLVPQKYNPKEFTITKPEHSEIIAILETEARNSIKKLLFWKNKKLRIQYVNDNLEDRLKKHINEWNTTRDAFCKNEKEVEILKNKEYHNEYLAQKKDLENYLAGEIQFIHDTLEQILSDISLPVDFSIDFDYNEEIKTLLIDLDLPEIEDMPQDKASILASGKVSVKAKTQKELKHDYATCVIGIAFYFATVFFNITSKIDNIQVSGYTQRISKKTGNLEDEYVYSILFDRETLGKINIKNIHPIEAIKNFKHIIDLTSTYELKTIQPLENTDKFIVIDF